MKRNQFYFIAIYQNKKNGIFRLLKEVIFSYQLNTEINNSK